jgi:hypothetical protein
MTKISLHFTLLSEQVLNALGEQQPSNVNKNAKEMNTHPLPIYFPMKSKQIFPLQ